MNLFAPEHMLIVAIVAMLVVKPEQIPALMRSIGKWMAKWRALTQDLQGQAQGMMNSVTDGTGDLVASVTGVTTSLTTGIRSLLDTAVATPGVAADPAPEEPPATTVPTADFPAEPGTRTPDPPTDLYDPSLN